ncbi:signal peptidase, partial [Cardiosporidium cionae]
MVKNRMSALDIRAMISECRQELLGLRIANIYDIYNNRLYMLKFSSAGQKYFLLIEAGRRFHITNWQRNKNAVPSGLTMKLRKHLRTARLESLEQIGCDRVVDLTFGTGETAHHLIVELYVSGNIILTDAQYKILIVLRTHVYSEDSRIAVRQRYPIEGCVMEKPLCFEEMRQHLLKMMLTSSSSPFSETMQTSKNLKEKPSLDNLSYKTILSSLVPFAHPSLLSHCFTKVNISPSSRISPETIERDISSLYEAATVALTLLQEVSIPYDDESSPSRFPIGGYIIYKQTMEGSEVYEEFTPSLLEQHGSDVILKKKFNNFYTCVDEFFSQMDVLKAVAEKEQSKEAAFTKTEKISVDQKRRISNLEASQTQLNEWAELIEKNISLVDNAIALLRHSLSTKINWMDLWNYIKKEQRSGHPIATYIHSLSLEKNEFSLLLSHTLDVEDVMEDKPSVSVPVSLALSARQNISHLHTERKQSKIKLEKTILAMEKVIKRTTKAAKKQQDEKPWVMHGPSIRPLRKKFWFEKFHWFISSERYLILSGKDASLNEILYRRYLEKNDLYVHADIHGAATCIIKNPHADLPVPLQTLIEAGNASVCRSSAWNNKIITNAWWVYSHQVSKTAPTGEYLRAGGFMIRGKRNHLPPIQLEMGLALLFQLDEESRQRRKEKISEGEKYLLEDTNNASFMDGLEPFMKKEESLSTDYISLSPLPLKEQEKISSGILSSSPSFRTKNCDIHVHFDAEMSYQTDAHPLENADKKIFLAGNDSKAMNSNAFLSAEWTSQADSKFSNSPTENISSKIYLGETKSSSPSSSSSTSNLKQRRAFSEASSSISSFLLQKKNSCDEASPPMGFTVATLPSPRQLLSHATKFYDLENGNFDKEIFSRYMGVDAEENIEKYGMIDVDEKSINSVEATSELVVEEEEEESNEEDEKEDAFILRTRDEEKTSSSKPSSTSKMHISAFERRQKKKNKNSSFVDTASTHNEGNNFHTKKESDVTIPRGKRTKLKRMKERYKDQDEEEKKMALELIGSVEVTQGSKKEMQRLKMEGRDDANVKHQEEETESHVLGKSVHRTAQWMKHSFRSKNAEGSSTAEISELCGTPDENDCSLSVIPVCAPYAALKNYRYRVKLTPGTSKRGQASQQMLKYFIRLAKNDVIKELIKSVKIEDISQCLV